MSPPWKPIFSALALGLLLAHGLAPTTFLVDQFSIALLLLFIFPWIIDLLESLELTGIFKIRTRPQSPDQIASKAESEAASREPYAARGDQNLARLYRRTEALGLRALGDALLVGWSLTPKQVLEARSGATLEADAIIRGPRGWRDVVVETKILPFEGYPERLVEQASSAMQRAVGYAGLSGVAYQPLIMWISISRENEKLQFAPAALASVITTTGIYAATYDLERRELAFFVARPFFLRQDVRVIPSAQ